jgi:dihydropteroate synthase
LTTEKGLQHILVSGGEPLVWGRRTYVMGILNATPDSFSGDGLGADTCKAVDLALRMESEGADILDVGAESTRPGSVPAPVEEELERLIPALEAISSRVRIPISVDTYKPEVVRRALQAGATIINDQWGLQGDPAMAQVAADSGAPVVLMHNQRGSRYNDLISDIKASLARSISAAVDAGVSTENLVLDPGIGFGKTPEQNLEVLRRLQEIKALGFPLLVGASRKSTIGLVLGLPVDQRVEGTSATVSLSIREGADIVRVHDVQHMVRVSRMTDAVVRGWRPPGWPS